VSFAPPRPANMHQPDAQRQVIDFMDFMRLRSRQEKRRPRRPPTVDLADEPFIGMWKDRDDMQEGGAAWIRRLRAHEWNRQRRRADG
jgi:hypothetical protein